MAKFIVPQIKHLNLKTTLIILIKLWKDKIEIREVREMNDIKSLMDYTVSTIKKSGYDIGSKSIVEQGEQVFNIDYYDIDHITKYSFICKIHDGEAYVKISAAFLSGIEDDFNHIIGGKKGPIVINNMGKARECIIEYKLRADAQNYKNSDIAGLLKEVEDSIYNVRYRKYFGL
jgi:hypothetical protein